MPTRAQASVNPLERRQPWAQLPLLLLSLLFGLPFCWLISTSLQPREQALSVPPQWLPRLFEAETPEGLRLVSEPEPVASASLLVRFTAGPQAGRERLVQVGALSEDRLPLPGAGGVIEYWPVQLLQEVPAGSLVCQEWRAAKYGDRPPETWYLPPSAVRSLVRPVVENYPLALISLSDSAAGQDASIGERLRRSRMPWHGRDEKETRPVTFLTYLVNTCLVAGLGVLGTVLSCSLAAYGLARIRWRGRDGLFLLTLATMMVPFPVIMIPLYSVFRELGWIGTLLPLWVPAWFGSAFNIFLLRQFFLGIPSELSEAARIDGAGEWRIWWCIVMPLARPALAVVALFHFLYAWNDFIGPLLFLTEPEDFTLALGLQAYQSQSGGSEWHLLMAASVLMVLPIIVLFFFAQRTFIRGIATTGSKG